MLFVLEKLYYFILKWGDSLCGKLIGELKRYWTDINKLPQIELTSVVIVIWCSAKEEKIKQN